MNKFIDKHFLGRIKWNASSLFPVTALHNSNYMRRAFDVTLLRPCLASKIKTFKTQSGKFYSKARLDRQQNVQS